MGNKSKSQAKQQNIELVGNEYAAALHFSESRLMTAHIMGALQAPLFGYKGSCSPGICTSHSTGRGCLQSDLAPGTSSHHAPRWPWLWIRVGLLAMRACARARSCKVPRCWPRPACIEGQPPRPADPSSTTHTSWFSRSVLSCHLLPQYFLFSFSERATLLLECVLAHQRNKGLQEKKRLYATESQ